jgi:hypothetical protein
MFYKHNFIHNIQNYSVGSPRPNNMQPGAIHYYRNNSSCRATDYKHTNYIRPNYKPNTDYKKLNNNKNDDRKK